MYAKILIILVLAILCTGCTDPVLPDIPDPREWWNATPSAPAFSKVWDEETQTISIVSPVDATWLTIENVSAEPDLCTFAEILNVTAHVNYNLNAAKDFKFGWVQHSGKNGVTDVDISKLVNESYEVIIDEYGKVQVNTSVYNNETGLNETVMVNQTVVTGNHTETRYRDVWQAWTPAGNTMSVGESVLVKIVYHKKAELGDVRIQTIPMFAGIECEELTWWNTSWSKKVQLNVNNSSVALTDYQLMKNITYDSDMNANFSDMRFVNDSDTGSVPYWIESKTDSSTADVWLKIPSISTTTGAKVWMYYNNSDVNSASSGDDTFIFFDDFPGSSIDTSKWDGKTSNAAVSGGIMSYGGDNTVDMMKSITQFGSTIAFRSKVNLLTPSTYIDLYGLKNAGDTHWAYGYISYSPDNYIVAKDGTTTEAFNSNNPLNTWFISDIKVIAGTSVAFYINNVEATNSPLTTNAPNTNDMEVAWRGRGNSACVQSEWVLVRKYTATEPTWAADGEEESSSIITAYTPSTPLQKTTGDSQLFTVNTSENSQCRWYINGSLMQTNSTGATGHEYTNSSLDEGYWNFTATANTTNRTNSQTWWVTVAAAGTFGQDMYIDRWMYATYLNGSNTNLSEFFTDLSPYYLSFYNATDQKTYNYKSGRWEKYADKIIRPGEAAMLRYTANVTKTRDNADSTFGFTMKTGLNHIGHSYNGTRNLTWYNTTIASANLVTVTHQNPETGTISTFTYGSTDNSSVDVLQGCGVEVNVSSDTVISGL